MVVLTSFTQPTDGIRHRQPNTVVYVNDNNLGKGTLYIAESRLSWIGESGNGFAIEYPHISLHAISRDLSAFPQECIFLMLDTPLGDECQSNGEETDDDGNDDNSSRQETTEMRLVPDDRGMLDAMFHAMNACQALHPDPESFSDEDFFEDASDEIPMEETDSQMAQLRIGNMDGRAHIVDRMENILKNRGAGTAEGILGDMVGGTLAGRVCSMASCISGAGMAGDNRALGMVGDSRALGMGGDSTALGILGAGRGEDNTVLGTLEDREKDREAGTEADTEADMEARIHRGGRSFFSDSMSHPDRTAESPSGHSPHMVLDSNFDDAEN